MADASKMKKQLMMNLRQLAISIESGEKQPRINLIILVSFLSVIALMVFLISLGITGVRDTHSSLVELSTHEHKIFKNLYIMQFASRERTILLHDIILEQDPFIRDDKIQDYNNIAAKFVVARNAILDLKLSQEEQRLLKLQFNLTQQVYFTQEEIVQLVLSDNHNKAKQLLIEKAIPLQNQVLQILSELMKSQLDEAASRISISQENYESTYLLLIASGIAGIVLTTLITWYVVFITKALFFRLFRTTRDLKESNANLEFQKMATDAHNIVSATDADGNIIYVNDKFCEISEYTREELIGQNHRLLKSNRHDKAFYEEMWGTIASGKIWHGEVLDKSKSGKTYWLATTILPFMDEQGQPNKFISVRTDISAIKQAHEVLERSKQDLELLVDARTSELTAINEKLTQEIENRRVLEKELKNLANTDPLTGILNRRRFNELLGTELTRTVRYETPTSILIFDIDNFKSINDVHGHQVGDDVIRTVVNLVSNNLRAPDIFCRWGGEEFIVLAVNCDSNCAMQLAEKLRQLIADSPFEKLNKVTCSFGVTSYQIGDNSESLLKRADDNLYKAKMLGKNRCETDALSRALAP